MPGLPPAAREEAEQREHENDDQDDPENAQGSHLLRASFPHNRFLTTEGALNLAAFFPPRRRARTRDAKGDLDGLNQLRPRQRAGAPVRRDLRAQAALPPRPRARPEPDRLPGGLQARGQARPGRRGGQGLRVRARRVRLDGGRGLRGSARRGISDDRDHRLRPLRAGRPIYFARTYYLGPEQGGEKVYSLLLRALEDSGLAGISKFVMRDRQYLGALRVRDGVIALEQLYFADEIRPLDEIKPPKAKVSKEELAMAEQLIENFAGDFKPEKYKDTYRDALCEIIRAKRAGKEVHRPPETEEEAPPDLLEALRASIEGAGRGRGGHRRRARTT